MPKRLSKADASAKRPANKQAKEWNMTTLLHKDISEFRLTDSLRRLGNVRVMAWDFRTVMPAVNKLAHQEVDLVNIFKRIASYNVMDWDFRSALPAALKSEPPETTGPLDIGPDHAEVQALIIRLKNFLQYVVSNLIDEPGHAQIKIKEIESNVVRFKLVLVKRDVAMLIGREGHTASAIRSILKAAAGMHGVHALLVILSHEEDTTE